MLKKTIKYKDFDGQEVEDEFFFNLTKAEIIEFNLDSGREDLEAKITRLVKEKNTVEIYRIFKDIILRAYGKRIVVDGTKRFVKNQDVRDEFVQTGAFSELILDMLENPRNAAEFIQGCLPKELAEASKADIDAAVAKIDES